MAGRVIKHVWTVWIRLNCWRGLYIGMPALLKFALLTHCTYTRFTSQVLSIIFELSSNSSKKPFQQSSVSTIRHNA